MTDVNECEYSDHLCHMNASCSNSIGSYECTCPTGHHGNGFQCRVTCALIICDGLSYCVDKQFVSECICPASYEMEDGQCVPVPTVRVEMTLNAVFTEGLEDPKSQEFIRLGDLFKFGYIVFNS